jgi:hypothetical protein
LGARLGRACSADRGRREKARSGMRKPARDCAGRLFLGGCRNQRHSAGLGQVAHGRIVLAPYTGRALHCCLHIDGIGSDSIRSKATRRLSAHWPHCVADDNKGQLRPQAGPARSQPAAAARRRQGALKGSLRPACRLRPRGHQRASLIRSKATQSLKPAGVNRSGCISLAETPVSEGSLRNDREYPFVSLINVHRWFCIAGAPQDPAAERPSLKRNGPSAGCG